MPYGYANCTAASINIDINQSIVLSEELLSIRFDFYCRIQRQEGSCALCDQIGTLYAISRLPMLVLVRTVYFVMLQLTFHLLLEM